MRVVEASAKTREGAIEEALKQLGVEMYEVDNIEIVDEGSRGFLGIGARDVRVKVSVEALPGEPEAKPREDRPPRDRDSRSRGRRGRGGRKPREEGRAAGEERSEEKPKRDRPKNERPGRAEAKSKRPDRSEGKDRPAAKKQRSEKPAAPRRNAPLEGGVAEAETGETEVFDTIDDAKGNEAAALMQEVIAKMGIEAVVAFGRTDDDTARLTVESEDGAILIGRKGRNLQALQYLVNRMISRQDQAENSERLLVDVEGYVERRRATLEDMAKGFARKAKETSRSMRLKPMSPQERRIIHLTLQDDPDIRTFSLGDSLYRSVVISPKDAKNDRPRSQRPRSNRSNRRGRGRGGNPQGHSTEVDAGQFGD